MRKTRIRIAVKVVIILAAAVYFHLNLGIIIVHQQEMFPAIRDGDLCISWKKADYSSQEIVLYSKGDTRHLGRIEAIGGETVNITDNGSLTVNDSIPYETIFYRTASDPDSSVTYPLTLGRDEYFVLNDYRMQFGDSRTFGPLKKEEIKGSVILILRHRGF